MHYLIKINGVGKFYGKDCLQKRDGQCPAAEKMQAFLLKGFYAGIPENSVTKAKDQLICMTLGFYAENVVLMIVTQPVVYVTAPPKLVAEKSRFPA